MNSRVILVILLALSGFTHSEVKSETESENKNFTINGWNEVVVSVRNIEYYHEFFFDIAQWQLKEEGQVGRDQLDAWQLPEQATAKYALFANPGTETGFIKLVQFSGVEQSPIRTDSQSWDTGGIFDINVRVKNLEQMAERMRAAGWQARSPVTTFTFGPFTVKEWIVYSPDGLIIAMIERLKPELEGWPNLKSVSRTFNSTQVVADMPESLAFYEEVLGFQRYMEHAGVSSEEGPNVLGLPQNMTTKVPREIYILHPRKKNEGSVEILNFKGATGSDFSQHAKMPNLGIVALRFPVIGLSALQENLIEFGVSFVHSIKKLDGCSALTVQSPEGSWLEFYEPVR